MAVNEEVLRIMFSPYDNDKIIQWDLTYAGHQVTQNKAEGMLLNYTKANVGCYNPLGQQCFEEISIELKFVNCLCKYHIQRAICWHGNCPNGIIFDDAMCNIKMPIYIASRAIGVCRCQISRASSTSPT